MNLLLPFPIDRLSSFAKTIICFIGLGFLLGCQPSGATTISTTPTVEFIISTTLPNTPTPACVILPNIELTAEITSENSVHIKITGLKPNEIVNAIFRSRTKDQEKEIVLTGLADEKGVFEDSEGLRGQKVDFEFKEWELLIVHSRGSTCTKFVLP